MLILILLIIVGIPLSIYALAWTFIGLVALMDVIELGVKRCLK